MRHTAPRRFAFACLLTSALGPALPAAAADFTGTWAGKFKCTDFDGTPDKFTDSEQTLQITQTGTTINVQFVGVVLFTGLAFDDTKSPADKGQIGISSCDTHPDVSIGDAEIAVLTGSADAAKGKGSLKGSSIYTFVGDTTGEGSCKWSFKRISIDNPNIGGCM